MYLSTVVLAKRLKEIIQLEEVLGHPYFSTYLSTLIYDASCYTSKSPSQSFTCYIRASENATLKYRDEDCKVAQLVDDATWNRLSQHADSSTGL